MYGIIIKINVVFVTATCRKYTLLTNQHGYFRIYGTKYGNNVKCSWTIRLPSSVKKVGYKDICINNTTLYIYSITLIIGL